MMAVDPASQAAAATTGAAWIGNVGLETTKIVVRTIPHGFQWLKTRMGGRTILVLGPPRAGKTMFMDYLEFGVLQQEEETQRTVGIVRRDYFILKLGRDGNLTLHVRRPLDASGDVGPQNQMDFVKKYKPHALVLVLDASSPLTGTAESPRSPYEVSSLSWLKAFCQSLGATLGTTRKIAKRLRSITVLLNKQDKLQVPDGKGLDAGSTFKDEVKKVIDQSLGHFRDKNSTLRVVPIRPCSLVKPELGTMSTLEHRELVRKVEYYLDDILQTIALNMVR